MEELVSQLIAKVGLDEATAQKVVAFLQENAAELPKMLASTGLADKLPAGLGDSLPGGLGGLFGK